MRSKNSIFNMIGSLGSYFIATICVFITQSIIIKVLGIEYSGINGLFTNILTMLSVAELGIGTTIIFKLYKPIADNDTETIKSWLKFYKKCYKIVAISIFALGIILIPFIPFIVGKVTIKDNLILLYLISLLDTVFSYCMTYKRSLLYANQKNYIINIVHIGYTIFMSITQIVVLYLTNNYVYFLIVKLIYRILENIILNTYINIKYPYVKDKANDINKEEKNDVLNRIKSIFLQKVSFIVNKGIDNIIISLSLGVIAVGYYNNYNIVVTALTAIIYQIVSSMTASVGDLLTENDIEKSYNVYKKINMLNSFITGLAIIGFGCVMTPLIKVWLGAEYILPNYILFSFALYIYSDSIRRTITIYKEAAGICIEDKYMYVIMTLINLILSIILCKFIGIAGVILGTAISYLFLIIYSYPKYIFEPLFKKSKWIYYKENFKYLIVIIITLIITFVLCKKIVLNSNIVQVICNSLICIVVYSIIFILCFRKKEEYKFYYDIIKTVIKYKK